MKHILILGPTGVLMGLLSSLVGLPTKVEMALWTGLYLLWVVYGVRVKIEMPVRRMGFVGTCSGLLTGSTQVILMEQYKANNPWYGMVFDTSTAQDLSVNLLGEGIAMGLFCGLLTGLLVRLRLSNSN